MSFAPTNLLWFTSVRWRPKGSGFGPLPGGGGGGGGGGITCTRWSTTYRIMPATTASAKISSTMTVSRELGADARHEFPYPTFLRAHGAGRPPERHLLGRRRGLLFGIIVIEGVAATPRIPGAAHEPASGCHAKRGQLWFQRHTMSTIAMRPLNWFRRRSTVERPASALSCVRCTRTESETQYAYTSRLSWARMLPAGPGQCPTASESRFMRSCARSCVRISVSESVPMIAASINVTVKAAATLSDS